MLEIEEIKKFLDNNKSSEKYSQAEVGLAYYESKHDIEQYKIFYTNSDGDLIEDKYRSNVKISHPFFTELIDQCAQYMLSGQERYVVCDDQKLQAELDKYFDDDFKMELNDLITFAKIEGDSFLYRYVDEDFKTRFKFADGMNVVEVSSKYSKDGKDNVIYEYLEKLDGDKKVYAIQVWDDQYVYYYTRTDNEIVEDKKRKKEPHIVYQEGKETLYDTFGDVPFLRLDNNRKRLSDLHVIKDLIDDYDLMSCGLSNNLQDVAEGIYVVKGWNGNNLDELIEATRVKKQVSVGEGGDFDIKTINVPYQARQVKMGIDETNIYRFGMGVNTALVGDGNVTNVVIKSRYALLDMKCNKMEAQLKRLMKKVIKIVVEEINKNNKTNYDYKDVWCEFTREIMTNAIDNAQISQIEAQTEQVKVATLLQLAPKIGDDMLLERLCEVMDLDIEEVKEKIKQNAPLDLNQASEDLMKIEVDDEESTQANGTGTIV